MTNLAQPSLSRHIGTVIVLIYGTRPDAIKQGPIAAALRANKTPVQCISTGQHTDLLRGTPAESDLADSLSLGFPGTGDAVGWPQQVQPAIEAALQEAGASLVVVQGDTMSAVTGARGAHSLGIPVAHVEAGLRSGNDQDPWPEELFRKEITQLASWHFAPTLCAYDNLISEGILAENIFLTGNPVISAIYRYTQEVPVKVPDLTVLFTMHRREWLLGGIRGVLDGLYESAERYPELNIVWPMHPGVARVIPGRYIGDLPKNVRVIDPLPYRANIQLLARSLGVATDSGGLVEEASYLGVPAAVLRRVCDRPESLEAGVARLYPPTYEGVIEAFTALRERTILRQPTTLYGTHLSAEKIAVLLGNLVKTHTPSIVRV